MAATSDTITINKESIAPGETRGVILNIARLPTHTTIDLPVFVYRSDHRGPTLLISAGLHGDEINGIEIIRRLIRTKTIIPQTGTVIAIPVVNIYAFIHYSRNFPEGKDMNRCFPGNPNGSLSSRIAYVMINEILPLINYGVDFHTGGASKANYPHLRVDFSDPKNLELAKAFAPPFIVDSRPPDKSFRKVAGYRRKNIMTFEGGESLRFDEFTIKEGIEGVGRLMNALNMGNHNGSQAIPHILKSSHWTRAKFAGLFRSHIQLGQHIKKNQALGTITDPYGESEVDIKAAASGYVIGINHQCVVNKGDALIHVGSDTVI